MAEDKPEVKIEVNEAAISNSDEKETVKEIEITVEVDPSCSNDGQHKEDNGIMVKEENIPENQQDNKKFRKRKRIRGKRRRPKKQRIMPENQIYQESPLDDLSNISSSEIEDEYCLIVSNLPNNWSYIEIKNYIDTECGPVDEIEFVQNKNKNVSGSIRLYFQTKNECEKAKHKLENKMAEGKNLCVKIEASTDGFESETLNTEPVNQTSPVGIDMDLAEEDPTGLYGLKPEFLKSLDITPPLTKWVCVSNFRCGKSELRDVLELAGDVLMCAVMTVAGKYARVMYSHPLESVQAVSMLDGQTFYGKNLKVVMDNCVSVSTILPKGLCNVGLGLGLKGQPLRDVAKHYTRHLAQKTSLVNPILFVSKNNNQNKTNNLNQEEDLAEKFDEIKTHINLQKKSLNIKHIEDASNFVVKVTKNDSDSDCSDNDKKVNEIRTITTHKRPVAAPKISPNIKPLVKSAAVVRYHVPSNPPGINPNFINGVSTTTVHNSEPGPPGIAEYTPQLPGPRLSMTPAVRTGQVVRQVYPGPSNAGPLPRPGFAVGPRSMPVPSAVNLSALPNPMAPVTYHAPRSFGPQAMPNPNSTTIRLSNLPLNTTFPYLCEKLSKCGQVLSLQLTQPGCAVVSFATRGQAERCQKTYHRLPAEGNIIEVHFV